MNLITASILLAACVVAQADSEAFFLPNLLSNARSATRHQPLRHGHPRQTKQFSHQTPRQHRPRHPAPLRPARQVKSFFPNQSKNRPGAPHHGGSHARNNLRTDPGAKMKLDFGGWTPINFDENLPAKLKRGIKIEDLKSVSESAKPNHKIVTIDTAIATAPPAETDDLQHHHTVHVPTSASAPALTHPPANSPASAPFIPSTADHKPVIYVDSSNAPLSTYHVLDANNPAIAPVYEPSKPSFQAPHYIPRPAVPSKPYKTDPPALAARYQPQPAIPPKYEEPTQPAPPPTPKYQTKPTPKYQTKSRPQYQPAIPPAYEEPIQTSLPALVPSPSPTPSFDNEKYPIVALITADSDVPEEEKFVQFSINGGSPDSLIDLTDNKLDSKARPAKDVTKENDELYYIYYQDPELDPSFGVKIQQERDTKYLGLDGLDIPLYDYDEAAIYRPERDQPSFGVKSSSSVSFKQNIGGQKAAFSYNLS